MKLTINYSIHASKLGLPVKQRKLLLANLFIQGLNQSTRGYRSVMKNEALCIHYRMDRRMVSLLEMLQIAWRFYRNWKGSTRSLWVPGGYHFGQMELHVVVHLLSAISSRLWMSMVRRPVALAT